MPKTVVDDFSDAVSQLRERAAKKAAEGKWIESIEFLDQAIAADSGTADLYALRSRARSVVGQYARALTDANLCIALGSAGTGLGYVCKGRALLHMRQYKRAVKEFQTALELDPDDEQAKESLAQAKEGVEAEGK